MKSVRDSKTIDLLRAPLILTMCVGLYAQRPTMIPSTISELYRSMIEEMLERHSFRHDDPDDSVLVYRVGDKYRFLRYFAMGVAWNDGEFGEFSKEDLMACFHELRAALEEVDDPKAFVAEIIKHSGLISDVSDSGVYVFAHRSIQEFLAAEGLWQLRNGKEFLMGKASDSRWRQTVLFYTAGQDAHLIDDFIMELTIRNPDLAGQCLQAAKPSDEAARAVLDALEPVTSNARISALAAATRSPCPAVREMAIERLKNVLSTTEELPEISSRIEGMLPFLDSLAGANAAEIAVFVPNVIRRLADDARLVGPLWQCLNAPEIELKTEECSAIIERLITLAMDPNYFVELERQDAHDRDFLTNLKTQAYPFRRAFTLDHNLVTLLSWADYLRVVPKDPNRFFQAKIAHRLGRVEFDRRWTIPFAPCRPARIVSAAEILLASIVACYVLIARPGLISHPYGWLSMPIFWCVAAFAPLVINALIASIAEGILPRDSFLGSCFTGGVNERGGLLMGSGNIASLVSNSSDGVMYAALAWLIVVTPISALPLVAATEGGYFATIIGGVMLFLLTNNSAFETDASYYLYRPNLFVDVYDDPRSRHWVTVAELDKNVLSVVRDHWHTSLRPRRSVVTCAPAAAPSAWPAAVLCALTGC